MYFQLVMVLNMTSAEICTYTVQHGETVASLQKRIEQDVHIPLTRQELLLEAGLALEPHNEIMHCAVDYAVSIEALQKIKKAIYSIYFWYFM